MIGGPVGDAGLTGRKIIVDTYGGMARHGGGAFSGKDPSKVDRSAAYAARYVAKNVVAAGLADRCEVQVAYAIGVAHPVSVYVETFGTEKIGRAQIAELVDEHFDLRPGAFREYLKLHRPIYQKTAAYGHFGREDHDFTWERTDKAEALRAAAGLGAGPAPSAVRGYGGDARLPARVPLRLLDRRPPGRGRQRQQRLVGVGARAVHDLRRVLGRRDRPVAPLPRGLRAARRARPERAPAVARVVADRAGAGRVQRAPRSSTTGACSARSTSSG